MFKSCKLFYRIRGRLINRADRWIAAIKSRIKEPRDESGTRLRCTDLAAIGRDCHSARCLVVTSARDHHRPGMSRLNQIPPGWTEILPASARYDSFVAPRRVSSRRVA